MIQIRKHDKVISIPSGAFKMYASAGWELVENSKAPSKKKVTEAEHSEPEAEAEAEDGVTDEDSEVSDEDEDEAEYEEIEVDPEELLEKPLEELDFEELNIVAEYLGIDTSKLKTSKALRAAIKKNKE